MIKILLLTFILTPSCVSNFSQLNRRPFADKVAFVSLAEGNYQNAKSVGEIKVEHCEKKWLGWFGSTPTFEQVKTKAVQDSKILYVKNFTSLEWGETGFLGGLSCVGFEGEGFTL